MGFCSFDDGDDGEHYDVGFVEISEMYVVQYAFLFGTQSLDFIMM